MEELHVELVVLHDQDGFGHPNVPLRPTRPGRAVAASMTASPIAIRSQVLCCYGRCETLRKRKHFVVDGAHLTREKVAEMLNFYGVVAIIRQRRQAMVNQSYDLGNLS